MNTVNQSSTSLVSRKAGINIPLVSNPQNREVATTTKIQNKIHSPFYSSHPKFTIKNSFWVCITTHGTCTTNMPVRISCVFHLQNECQQPIRKLPYRRNRTHRWKKQACALHKQETIVPKHYIHPTALMMSASEEAGVIRKGYGPAIVCVNGRT